MSPGHFGRREVFDDRLVKLNWEKLLAFDQVKRAPELTPVRGTNGKEFGGKVGEKLGVKVGAKEGLKNAAVK